jgi:hypothetical protein
MDRLFVFSLLCIEKDLYLGLRRMNVLEIQEERDRRMRSEYYDPIERFPDKLDQLIEALEKLGQVCDVENYNNISIVDLDQNK